MSREPTFIEKCLLGYAFPDDIDEAVQRWHVDETIDVELPEYLGLKQDEYEAWMHDSSVLLSVISARVAKVSWQQYIEESMALPLAARGQGLTEDSAVVVWLRKTGRIK